MSNGLIETGIEYKERALSGMVRESARWQERWMAQKRIKLSEAEERMSQIESNVSSGTNLAISGASYGLGGGGGGGGKGCCITLFELGCLTDSVRTLRDQLFDADSYVAKGYMKMSNWLVPILKRQKIYKVVLKYLMGIPIAKFSHKKNPIFIPICVAWCVFWELYGRI
jgi:hypothetical protein